MSTLQLENIKHPDASGNALELASDGTLAAANKFTSNIVTTQKFSCDTDTTPPTDGAAYFYKQSAGTTVSGYQAIIETGSAGARNNSMLIDYAGRVTTPYQVGFKASGLASQVTDTSGNTNYVFNNTVAVTGGYNTGNHYNASTGIFTVPIDGVYIFGANLMGDSTDDRYMIRIKVNGVGIHQGSSSSNNTQYQDSKLSVTMKLNANDTVSIGNWGGKLNYGGNNPLEFFFWGHLLG